MILRAAISVTRPELHRRLKRLLGDADVVVDKVPGRQRLWRQIARGGYDLLVIERARLPEPHAAFVRSARQLPETPSVVVMSDGDDEEDRARLIADGCAAVLSSSLSDAVLKDVLAAVAGRRQAVAKKRLADQHRLEPRLSNFVSASPAMQAFMRVVNRVVSSDTSLLITGETGVGKEWLARAIHAESPRRDGPFVAVNCGALPETLLESELFGHEEGAFTGATRVRRGLFETAHGGTIFLDEIGEMPLHLQVKLLRVLESREVQRVGAEAPLRLDVRVMAASNRNLEAEVEVGGFRPDLYYRLGVVTLAVPALRERREDIPTLARSYIDHFSHQFPHTVERIAPEAMAALVEYDWPGNVRELMNVIERAMLLCESRAITSVDLPDAVGGRTSSGPTGRHLADFDGEGAALASVLPDAWLESPLKDLRDALVESLERAYLSALLERARGRVGETARRAGIDPRSLYAKMRRLGLRKEDYR